MATNDKNALAEHCRFTMAQDEYLRQFETVFVRPIRDGYDAVPIGNGALAAVLWQPDHLTLMLNKCDISMEASQAARLVFETPKPLAARAGRLEARLSLATATAKVTYTGGELGQGEKAVCVDDSAPESKGMWRGVYGALPRVQPEDMGTVRVSAFVPAGRNVLVVDYEEGAPRPRPLRIRLERWLQPTWGDQAEAIIRDGIPTISYRLTSGVRYAVAMAFSGFAGAAVVQSGPLQLALEVPAAVTTRGRLALAVVTSHEADDPVAAAVRLAQETLAADAAELTRNHEAHWADYWGKFLVDSGHPYANMLYHMALYELGITSCGRRPVKFNGALNLWDEDARAWGGSYWCHNQHSVYLPVYAANHAELADNFLAWIAKVRPEAVKAGRKYHSAAGAFYSEVMDHDFTVEAPEVPVPKEESGSLPYQWEMKYILSSGTRYALLLWDRYRYTLDNAFLRDKAYPVIRDVAEFYVSYGKLGADGKYHVAPSISWETRPLGRDAHADCAAWRIIFKTVIAAAKLLGVDAGRVSTWRERLRQAPPYPVADALFSVVTRDDGTPEPSDHFVWQVSNLAGVFPYGDIGITSPAVQRRMAEATFERYRCNPDAGHEYLPLIAARLGLAEGWRNSLYQFMQFFQNFDQGLFNYYSIVGNKDEESANRQGLHPYLESSGIFAAAISEMLLQSHDDTIRVFPAAPAWWHSRFILRAAGSFLVASEHRGQAGVPYILIEPLGGEQRRCRVALPPTMREVAVTADGGAVPFKTEKGRVISFEARPDVVYAVTPHGKKLEDVPMVRIAPRTDGSPARLGMVWYGQREGANNHTATFPLW